MLARRSGTKVVGGVLLGLTGLLYFGGPFYAIVLAAWGLVIATIVLSRESYRYMDSRAKQHDEISCIPK